LDKDNVQGLLPQFVKDASDIESKLGLLESLKIAYAQLVAQKSKENLSYRNTLLITMVLNEACPLDITSLKQLVDPDTHCPSSNM